MWSDDKCRRMTVCFSCWGVGSLQSGILGLNRPPASIFMGDSGSLFLGLAFSWVIVAAVVAGQIGVWT